jgi:hypothetical protein
VAIIIHDKVARYTYYSLLSPICAGWCLRLPQGFSTRLYQLPLLGPSLGSILCFSALFQLFCAMSLLGLPRILFLCGVHSMAVLCRKLGGILLWYCSTVEIHGWTFCGPYNDLTFLLIATDTGHLAQDRETFRTAAMGAECLKEQAYWLFCCMLFSKDLILIASLFVYCFLRNLFCVSIYYT